MPDQYIKAQSSSATWLNMMVEQENANVSSCNALSISLALSLFTLKMSTRFHWSFYFSLEELSTGPLPYLTQSALQVNYSLLGCSLDCHVVWRVVLYCAWPLFVLDFGMNFNEYPMYIVSHTSTESGSLDFTLKCSGQEWWWKALCYQSLIHFPLKLFFLINVPQWNSSNNYAMMHSFLVSHTNITRRPSIHASIIYSAYL